MTLKKKAIAACVCAGVLVIGAAGVVMANSPVISAGSNKNLEVGGPGTVGNLAGAGESDDLIGLGADADSAASSSLRIYGPVEGFEDGALVVDNQSGVSGAGSMVLNIDPEQTLVLDAVYGYPVQLDQIEKGDTVYAYIGDAMTMSLPPHVNAELVLCQVPEDGAAPAYVTASSMTEGADGSWSLTAADGTEYAVPAACEILPYLTRNIVMLEDIHAGSRCLVWQNENSEVTKIVLFAE
jgi:hypothetical protein